MNGNQDTKVIRIHSPQDATRTLVCLGFCGGGTAAYHQWSNSLPPRTALAAVCYPGREGRFLEDCATHWDELAEDATATVLSAAADRPYVLFGHSMGGWMAFEVATRIERGGGRAPETLVVSSCNAPDRGLTPRDMFPAQHQTDAELMTWMKTHGLMPEHVVGNPDLEEMAVELMRADIKVRDTFHYTPGAKVRASLQVLSGADDSVIESDAGDQWRGVALGGFRHDVLPGGHFYTPATWSRLPERIPALSAPAGVAA
ncbi:alpha/beta fold hydrolase [Streptomyces roseifaciens]